MLGGQAATNDASEAEDPSSEERERCGFRNCRRIGQTDEALAINRFLVLTGALCGAGRRDPVELADQGRRDCGVAECVQIGQFVCKNCATACERKMAAILGLPDRSLKPCRLG